MKKWLLTLALPLLSPSFSFAADDCTANEERYLNETRGRFDLGEVTNTNVAGAEYWLLLAQERCHLIDRGTFCAKVLPVLSRWEQGMAEEARVGRYSDHDLAELRFLKAETKRNCQ